MTPTTKAPPLYYSTQQVHGQWRILRAGRPRWDRDRWWSAPTESEARALVDQLNRDLTPSMGAQCPMCGSSNTYTTGDGWLVCMNCGARSQ